MMKTAAEIRTEFLEFFKSRQHQIVPSSPIVPLDDPTLWFINAGMNQFKDVFLGVGTRPYTRAADTQKCIRVSGKHNDLEEVGRDTYHHTFFEMLGNWSFGDYFKKEAIHWAWELLTKNWGIPKHALWATVFAGNEKENLPADDEAEHIWATEVGLAPDRVLRFGKKENFWEMGETGPCGPCSEIHVDLKMLADPNVNPAERRALVNAGDPSLIEIWNLVFMQFNRQDDGTLVPLPQKHVDTGMGLERVTMVLQGKTSNYDTDLFTPIIAEIAAITGKKYTARDELSDVAFRVLSDHIRSLAVAFADGALPGNSGRGYVLRRILRRAARFAHQGLGMTDPFMFRLVPVVAGIFKEVFPEIEKRKEHIALLIKSEEQSFGKTLSRGIELFGKLAQEVKESGSTVIPGDKSYQLYHQDGFPRDLVDLMAREQGFAVDDAGWKEAEKRHIERSQGTRSGYEVPPGELEGLPATRFIGYSRLESNARILKLIGNDRLILDRTPFYAEAGGQVGDMGTIMSKGFKFIVADTQKIGDICVHCGELQAGDMAALPEYVTAYVERERRRKLMANHTATHLLHWALRKILGEHVAQQGSLVAPDRLRFDISHPARVTSEELSSVEELVNARIYDNIPVRKEIDTFERAKKRGAMALFSEKYGDKVRMVTIGRYSKELCGGIHVYATGDIGYFQIVSESAVQAGVRRIEAVTRDAAVTLAQRQKRLLDEVKDQLKVGEDDNIVKRISALQEELKKLKKESGQQTQRDHRKWRDELLEKAPAAKDVKMVVAEVESMPSSEMRTLVDLLRKASVPAAGILVSRQDGKAFLVTFVSEKFAPECGIHAGELMKIAAPMIGGGGDMRRADFAQGQGPDLSRIEAMLAKISEVLREKLSTR